MIDYPQQTGSLSDVALYVLNGDAHQVQTFFFNPHHELNGDTPYHVSRTELGVRQVEEILWKIFYGIPV
jgi:uncharacterized protein (DUF2384 family)